MHVIEATNVNNALYEALWWLQVAGVKEDSRNGPVLVSPEPVATIYDDCTQRVLFSPTRDANPYFHLMEALWMLAGRNDVEFPARFNSRFNQFAEANGTVHGAYGYRWRDHWGQDQLSMLVRHLRTHPNSRRAVLAMWDANHDTFQLPTVLGEPSPKDVPCNTHAYLDLRGDALNLFMCCRSNDAVWGAFGANAVHMSMLLEYLAAWGGWKVGHYTQMSYNLHAYTKMEGYPSIKPEEIGDDDRYLDGDIQMVPLVQGAGDVGIADWNRDLARFLSDPEGDTKYEQPFFHKVVAPMYASWADRKAKRNDGMKAAEAIEAEDWRAVCCEWIQRREERK